MADQITEINAKIVGSVTGINWASVLGWILLVALLIGGAVWGWIYYTNKRTFNKKVTVLEVVGINYVPTFVDKAKVVKIGTGGFEILYLQKLKCYRIGYGGRVGKDNYYFFVGKDGYWYNGMLSADIYSIDQHKGLIPIVTTNPSMRAQYTSLEKQIDTLHSEKKSFMEKYGMWLMGAGFILVIGVFFWLIAKEISPIISQIGTIAEKQAIFMDKADILITHLNQLNTTATNNGLIALK